MLFNNDSMVVVSAILVLGVFSYTFYNNIFTTVPNNPIINNGLNNESLINTNSSLDPLNELSSNLQYVEANVQTANINVEASVQTANTYVNTGMQTSARMWYQSVKNWIDEILGTTSNTNPQYVDVGVQTNATSTWGTVKQWFLEVCSVRSSELSSLGQNKVAKWRNKLDSIQSVDLHDSESTLNKITFHDPNDSTLDKLVNPDDSASQISEVISELQDVGSNIVGPVYNITDPTMYVNILREPGVEAIFSDDLTQTFLKFNDILLTVDPSIANYFI